MKKLIVLFVFAGGCFSLCFAQTVKSQQVDTCIQKPFTFYDPILLLPEELFQKHRDSIFYANNTFTPVRSDIKLRPLSISMPKISRFTMQDNMPCLKPKGNYTMKIYRPDTKMKYCMQIVPVG